MKDHSKTTSRRSFAKSVAGAVAAGPLASLVFSQRAQSQTRRRKGISRSNQEAFYHENTPPPITVNDGSLEIVLKHRDANTPLTQTNPSSRVYFYKGALNGADKNNIEHIKVLHGSGEWIYRDLDAKGSNILIAVTNQDKARVGTLEIEGSDDEFRIKSTGYGNGAADGKLLPSKTPGIDHYKHKWTHQGGPAGRLFRVTRILITKGGTTTLDEELDLDKPPYDSQEYRVMIWLAD